MIESYITSDAKLDDDASMVVLPSSTDLFYFYRDTLAQCSNFSTGKELFDMFQLFAKHLRAYCKTVLLDGLTR